MGGGKAVLRLDIDRIPGGRYADDGCSVEVYTNPDPVPYVELETLGPQRRLAVEESLSATNRYSLFPRGTGIRRRRHEESWRSGGTRPDETPTKVALLVETSNAYARELLHGVRSWLQGARSRTLWLAEAGRGADPPPWVQDWRGDGIIARIETPAVARAVAATGLPAVDVSAARLLPDVPWLETDDRAIAQMAAEHLQERGFRNFGCCGDSRFNWSRWRGDAFALHLARHGFGCAVFREPRPASGGESRADWETELSALGRWIRALPKPVGILPDTTSGAPGFGSEPTGGTRVPDTVAVLGVDNDELLCDLADPPLSSVIPDVRRTGYEAAALLDRLMRGGERSGDGRLFAPAGVATPEHGRGGGGRPSSVHGGPIHPGARLRRDFGRRCPEAGSCLPGGCSSAVPKDAGAFSPRPDSFRCVWTG